jgi:Skp family chaperone for outer membrane proteins
MSEQATPKKRYRRWRYIIDWRQQMGFTVEIVAVLCGVCVIYSVGVHYLLGNESLFQVSIDRFREVVLRVNAVYLAVSSGIFSLMAIGLTHRFVGPAFNMRRVLKGMIKGDYSRKVHLRKRDYLKDLATEINTLREQLQEQQSAVRDLERCLQEKDYDAARELVARLKLEAPEEQADEGEQEEAPSATEEPAEASTS